MESKANPGEDVSCVAFASRTCCADEGLGGLDLGAVRLDGGRLSVLRMVGDLSLVWM